MSDTYENIPSDRWAEYMRNAHAAVGEAADEFFATDPQIKKDGEAIVEDAGVILDVDSRSSEIPEGAQQFVNTFHDMKENGQDVSGYIKTGDGFPLVTTAMGYIEAAPNRAALKHFDPGNLAEQTGQPNSVDVDETTQPEAHASDQQPPETPSAAGE